MKFVMRVTEMLSRTVIVDANDWADARDKVEAAYVDGQIELDYNDFTDSEVDAVRIACPGDIEIYEEVGVQNE